MPWVRFAGDAELGSFGERAHQVGPGLSCTGLENPWHPESASWTGCFARLCQNTVGSFRASLLEPHRREFLAAAGSPNPCRNGPDCGIGFGNTRHSGESLYPDIFAGLRQIAVGSLRAGSRIGFVSSRRYRLPLGDIWEFFPRVAESNNYRSRFLSSPGLFVVLPAALIGDWFSAPFSGEQSHGPFSRDTVSRFRPEADSAR